MNTEQHTPPPGMRLLTDDELTKSLPMDAMCFDDEQSCWTRSQLRGRAADSNVTYATATPPPTDWRKLVEELVKIIQDLADKGELYPNEEAIFTRAKSALEVKP